MRRIALPSVRAQELGLVPRPERRAASGASSAGRTSKSASGLRGRELVPGADELAVVAAVDAVADRGAELDRDRALVPRSSGTRCSAARRARYGRDDRLRRADRRCRRVQLPQWSATGGAVSGRATSTKISPRKNIEPASRSSTSVCLPRQPMPLRAASSTSSTGAESVKTRWPNGPIAVGDAVGELAAGAGAAPCDSRGRGHRSRPRRASGRSRRCHSIACQPGRRRRGR